MSKHTRWTASVVFMDYMVIAQCKSSKSELMRRLLEDDPLWSRPEVKISIMRKIDNKHFIRGLAIITNANTIRH
jgi:hypothetical protein